MCTVEGAPLGRLNIRHIQQAYGLVPRYERLRNHGMLILSELAEQRQVRFLPAEAEEERGLAKKAPGAEPGKR